MINQSRKYKIALVGDSLAGGGAEKAHAQLSVFFAENGIEVCNCIFLDWVAYEHAGSIMNLGKINPGGFFISRKIKRFLHFRKFVKQNNFDCIIDFRMRTGFIQELLIAKLVYDERSVYSVRSGILKFYFPENPVLSRLIYKDKKINTVSRAVAESVLTKKLASNAHCIYNPVDFKRIDAQKKAFAIDDSDFILAVGRMNDEVKQFDKLIESYAKSVLPKKGIGLKILGEGKNKAAYEALSGKLGVKHLIEFHGFSVNPFPYYTNALFTVLCSKNEGFPNVLVESLACATPVVSFNCFSGPNEIIIDKENGILVENQNFAELTEAIDLMTENKELYNSCKQNARQSVQRFSLENIGKQWLDYLKIT